MFFFRGLLPLIFLISFSAQAAVTDGQRAYEAENYLAAFSIFEKAALDGDPLGQFYLGECYFRGRGVPQDFALAVKWYRTSAEQNFIQAQERLGNLYLTGDFIPRDSALGVMWYSKAAEQGSVNAALIAGARHFEGKEVKRNV